MTTGEKAYYCGKTITPKTEAPGRSYTVGHGDTLRQIAQTHLGKGSRCTEIVKLNGRGSNVLYTGQAPALPEK